MALDKLKQFLGAGEENNTSGEDEYYEKEGTGGVGVLDIENNSSSLFAVNTNKAQTISGLKTFNTLPESSVVPTSDNQFVNKKYVDDNAGGGSSNYLGYIEDYTSSNRLDITDLEKGTYLISSKMGNWDELYLYVKATYNDEVKTTPKKKDEKIGCSCFGCRDGSVCHGRSFRG